MPEILPLTALTQAVDARQGFELALPHPLVGKTIFLRLPLETEWSYEVIPAELQAQRNLILRDQMWVTQGRARFHAVHSSGARVEFTVKVRPWKAKASSDARSGETSGSGQADERAVRSAWRWLRRLRPGAREEKFIIRCRQTERQIELRVRTADAGLRRSALEKLVGACRCH